jgi:hypothetical protein
MTHGQNDGRRSDLYGPVVDSRYRTLGWCSRSYAELGTILGVNGRE